MYGGGGNDRLDGGKDDDMLFGDDGDDRLNGGHGAYDMDGGAGNDNLKGHNGADDMDGGDGDDVLKGGGGHDTINGGAGNDVLRVDGDGETLYGGAGEDVFKFSDLPAPGQEATIGDFVGGEDRIELDAETFTALTSTLDAETPLSADEFAANDTGEAQDDDDFIVYNTSTGELYYDADGNGSGEAILLATLTGAPTLTADDFVVDG